MQLNSRGEGASNERALGVAGIDAAVGGCGATYDALWLTLGDRWFDGRRQCVIRERGERQSLSIEQVTPYGLLVHCDGAETGQARWSVELTREDADGWGGYDVGRVTSQTGHSVDALNGHLRVFCRLMSEGAAARFWEQ